MNCIFLKQRNKHLTYSSANSGSVAFEYVIVTIFGVGLSLLIMSTAKTMITDQLEQFKSSINKNLNIEHGTDESW